MALFFYYTAHLVRAIKAFIHICPIAEQSQEACSAAEGSIGQSAALERKINK